MISGDPRRLNAYGRVVGLRNEIGEEIFHFAGGPLRAVFINKALGAGNQRVLFASFQERRTGNRNVGAGFAVLMIDQQDFIVAGNGNNRLTDYCSLVVEGEIVVLETSENVSAKRACDIEGISGYCSFRVGSLRRSSPFLVVI